MTKPLRFCEEDSRPARARIAVAFLLGDRRGLLLVLVRAPTHHVRVGSLGAGGANAGQSAER